MAYTISNLHTYARYGQPDLVYADLICQETGDLVISATLEYIINAIRERNLEVINYRHITR